MFTDLLLIIVEFTILLLFSYLEVSGIYSNAFLGGKWLMYMSQKIKYPKKNPTPSLIPMEIKRQGCLQSISIIPP